MSATQATPNAAAAEPVAVLPGSLVFVSYYDAKNTVVNTLGRVLAIGTLDTAGISADGWPSLTIAVPKSELDPILLASLRWHEQFLRLTGVRHVSHGSHDDSKSQAAWQECNATSEDFPGLLEPKEAPPANPTYERHGIEPTAVVSIDQAAAVQSGKAPSPSVVSPLINEPSGGPETPEKTPETASEGPGATVAGATEEQPPADEKKPDETSSS